MKRQAATLRPKQADRNIQVRQLTKTCLELDCVVHIEEVQSRGRERESPSILNTSLRKVV